MSTVEVKTIPPEGEPDVEITIRVPLSTARVFKSFVGTFSRQEVAKQASLNLEESKAVHKLLGEVYFALLP